jgi:hypothetical protein
MSTASKDDLPLIQCNPWHIVGVTSQGNMLPQEISFPQWGDAVVILLWPSLRYTLTKPKSQKLSVSVIVNENFALPLRNVSNGY